MARASVLFLPAFVPPVVNGFGSKNPVPRVAAFISDTPEGWLQPTSLQHGGLLAKRPFQGRFDEFDSHIDEAAERFEMFAREGAALSATVVLHDGRGGVDEDFSTKLQDPVEALLARAALPEALNQQIRSDACTMGKAVSSLCLSARKLSIKLEIFGDNSCSRWHQDQYVGRGIVSYTGAIGTEYTNDANVDFWELYNCGKNACVIRDPRQVCSVDVGDFFFIRGSMYPRGAKGLIHKSPEVRYHPDGRVVNRLVLKVDVVELPPPDNSPPEGDLTLCDDLIIFQDEIGDRGTVC